MRPYLSSAFLAVLMLLASPELRAQTNSQAHCNLSSFGSGIAGDSKRLGRGLMSLPRNAVRGENLRWELPIAAATGLLIAEADTRAADRIQSPSLQRQAGRWSNAGLGMALGSGALAYGYGCMSHRYGLSNSGFKVLEAMGAAGTSDLVLKLAFDRQFPARDSRGEFWGGGRSFPSGHSATSFAFASALAHLYPHKRWVKWGAYALATGVSLSRYPAKKHFPSDILAGATLGYVIGEYVAEH